MDGPHPLQAVSRFGWSLAVAVLLVTMAGSKAQAQTPPTADPSAANSVIQVFRHPSGVEIHVLQLRPGIGDEEMTDALESAARLQRKNGKITPVVHEEAAASAPKPSIESVHVEPPPPPPAPVIPPPAAPGPVMGPPTVAALSCESSSAQLPNWYDRFKLEGLPATLLWQPPMANPLQPRMALNLTTLRNDTTTKTIDTAIGGELGLFRITPASGSGLQYEQDFFAVAVSRFANNSDFTAADFRFGFPLTFAYDNWHAKVGYEHTSTHLGDDFVVKSGRRKMANIRDEVVFGLDYVFADQLRLYGVFGYAAYITTPTNSPPDRYDMGVEWSKNQTTDWRGQPFAAFDLEFRGDQNYAADTTLQLGWQWKNIDNGRSFRTGVELYNGRSPYGQFYLTHERFAGYGVWIDF
jgi:hypothetical protein